MKATKAKNVIYIVFGLHAYQPPMQWPEITKQIDQESYSAVARALLNAPEGAIICADIALSLLEQLEKIGRQETIALFKQCVESGKLHLVNTAAYHPLLPLVPDYYIQRQLTKNAAGYEKFLGVNAKKITGLFPPEMAFSERIIEPIKSAGTSWMVVDDTTFCAYHHQSPPYNKIIKKSGVHALLMSHNWHKIAAYGDIQDGRNFLDALHYGYRMWTGSSQPAYIVLWMDWETFGHHDQKPQPPQDRIRNFLIPFLQTAVYDERFQLTTPEELISSFPAIENVFIPDGSWSTSSDDYSNGIAWPLWLNPRYKFHTIWWNLANYTLNILGATDNKELENLIDQALYSCQPWQWVNGNGEIAKEGLQIFQKIFEHYSVSVGIKERGMELIHKIRSA
ncbi:MAG: hypothetical protein HZC14_02065 [Candidatus Niyogibacteria bacterium]|nr:hypothetical protein [Candidatus Niyogibacteria bacterium]